MAESIGSRGAERRSGFWGRALPVATALAIAAACGNDGGSGEPTDTTPAAPTTTAGPETTTTTTPERPAVMLTFNDLDGGSPYIKVYAGSGESAGDRRVTGTYFGDQDSPDQAADVMPVRCIDTDGRTVASHPEVGEASQPDGSPITSETWYGLDIVGESQFATDVYADVDPTAASALPPC